MRGTPSGQRVHSFLRRGMTALATFSILVAGLVATAPSAPALPAEPLPCDGPNPDPGGPAAASDYYPAYRRTGADMGKPITPPESIARAFDWVNAHLTYCQSDTYPDRHSEPFRTDCSGFVSMVWQVKPKDNTGYVAGFDAGSIMAVADFTTWGEVQPGDALNKDGHIEFVYKVENGIITTIGFGVTPPEVKDPKSIFQLAMEYKPIRYKNMVLITPEMVMKAFRERVPRPRPHIAPPNGRTLVNFDSLFWADNEPFEITEPMLGGTVEVEIKAKRVKWDWDFGDRANPPDNLRTTDFPGRPFQVGMLLDPRTDVIKRYTVAKDYDPKVDVTWSGFEYRYRLVGPPQGNWSEVTTIPGEEEIPGPRTNLTAMQSQTTLGDTD